MAKANACNYCRKTKKRYDITVYIQKYGSGYWNVFHFLGSVSCESCDENTTRDVKGVILREGLQTYLTW
jgi:hypothetical protein